MFLKVNGFYLIFRLDLLLEGFQLEFEFVVLFLKKFQVLEKRLLLIVEVQPFLFEQLFLFGHLLFQFAGPLLLFFVKPLINEQQVLDLIQGGVLSRIFRDLGESLRGLLFWWRHWLEIAQIIEHSMFRGVSGGCMVELNKFSVGVEDFLLQLLI